MKGISKIINQILKEGRIPESSGINRLICFNKLAKEQGIPTLNDIRPIATTSNIIKILELMIKEELSILNNGLLSNINQIGFKQTAERR